MCGKKGEEWSHQISDDFGSIQPHASKDLWNGDFMIQFYTGYHRRSYAIQSTACEPVSKLKTSKNA